MSRGDGFRAVVVPIPFVAASFAAPDALGADPTPHGQVTLAVKTTVGLLPAD